MRKRKKLVIGSQRESERERQRSNRESERERATERAREIQVIVFQRDRGVISRGRMKGGQFVI